MKLLLFSIFGLLIISNVTAQNELWLDDGTVFEAQSIDIQIDSGYIHLINMKGKSKYFDTLDVFAVIQQLDTVFLYNNPDYPLEKAKMFVKGQIDGKKYKNYYVYSGAFLTGVASPILLEVASLSAFWSPLFSGAYVAGFSRVNTNSKFCNIPDNLKTNEDYIAGFKFSASKKKIMNNTIFSVAGLATGIVILSILED